MGDNKATRSTRNNANPASASDGRVESLARDVNPPTVYSNPSTEKAVSTSAGSGGDSGGEGGEGQILALMSTIMQRLDGLERRADLGSTGRARGASADEAARLIGAARSSPRGTSVGGGGLGGGPGGVSAPRAGAARRRSDEDSGTEGDDAGGRGADDETLDEAIEKALDWHPGCAELLGAILEGPVPLPHFSADDARRRAHMLDEWDGLASELAQIHDVDVRTVGHATLLVDALGRMRSRARCAALLEEPGVALARVYARWEDAVRGGDPPLTEREILDRIARGVQVPRSWHVKASDATLDLNACAPSIKGDAKPSKPFVESQKALGDIARGAGAALEEISAMNGSEALVHAVATLRRIQACAAQAAVDNATSLLAPVIAATAESYKHELRARVESALTSAERAEADKKAELKSRLESTATNAAIAQALERSVRQGKPTSPARQTSSRADDGAQPAGESKRAQKRNAKKGAAKAEGAASTAPKNSEKSPSDEKTKEGDEAQ